MRGAHREKHFDVIARADVANAFFDLLDAAEIDLRFASCFVGCKSAGAIFVGEEIGVGAEFGVEIGFGAFPAERGCA
jgi:hypothetical protein